MLFFDGVTCRLLTNGSSLKEFLNALHLILSAGGGTKDSRDVTLAESIANLQTACSFFKITENSYEESAKLFGYTSTSSFFASNGLATKQFRNAVQIQLGAYTELKRRLHASDPKLTDFVRCHNISEQPVENAFGGVAEVATRFDTSAP